MNTIPMSEIIERYGPGEGRHWFDEGTLEFFDCRLPEWGYEGPGGVFFVSSEKPPHGPRAYTVRKLESAGDIRTIGPFCQYTERSIADSIARKYAAKTEV